jgi:hypothetical protein
MHQECKWPINSLSSSTHMGWLGFKFELWKTDCFQSSLLAVVEDHPQKQNLYD